MYALILALTLGQPMTASADGKVVVIFAGLPAHAISGAVVSRDDKFGKPGVYVFPAKGDGWRYPVETTREELTMRVREVSPRASFFGRSIADVEIGVSVDALDEVNEARARRGLQPYVRDDGLTVAAMDCAKARADGRIAGHYRDFSFLPPGSDASAAGCAAWHGNQWGSCCTYERWTYAGAAWAMGNDGRRYMHLFVR